MKISLLKCLLLAAFHQLTKVRQIIGRRIPLKILPQSSQRLNSGRPSSSEIKADQLEAGGCNLDMEINNKCIHNLKPKFLPAYSKELG